MNPGALQQIQAWMKTVLVSQGDLGEKLAKAETAHGLSLEQVVANNGGASPARRLDVYAAGYVLRLVACLQESYPELCRFMGESLFGVFAKAYLVTQPPNSWSLEVLGQGFPEFLNETRPRTFPDEATRTFYALPAQIALLERAKGKALTAKGFEGTSPSTPMGSADHWQTFGDAGLIETPACLQRLTLTHDVPGYLRAFHSDPKSPLPPEKPVFLAVSRVQYRVTVLELADWASAFLAACEKPISLQAAAQASATQCNLSLDQVLAHLFLWLPTATQYGLLRRQPVGHHVE